MFTRPGDPRALLGCALAVGLLVGAAAAAGAASESAVLRSLRSVYDLGGLEYRPPQIDGWRSVGAGTEAVELVYAERTGEASINTRCHLVARRFAIPPGAAVPSPAGLAETSRQQQLGARGEGATSAADVQVIAGEVGLHTYAIRSSLGEETTLYERFYVALAPDKSAYIVFKLATQQGEPEAEPCFEHFYDSLASVRWTSAGGAGEGTAPEKVAEEE